jgi:AbrB family looped-hinge helix DNA binding protein
MVLVTKKYQVTIPKQIREALGIKAGDKVVFLKMDDGYKITRAKDIIKAGIDIFEDVDVTVKETKEGLGKGFKRICKGLYDW